MSLTVKEIERLRANSKKGIKEGTGKINRWGTDASGYQKYYDSREIPVLKQKEDRVVKTEIKGKNATVPTSRLDLMRTLEAKRKESANQPIPSLKYNEATNSALKSKKQADSPIITNGNYVKDDKREYDVDRFNLGAQSDDKVIAGMTGALTSLPGFKSLVGVYDNLYEKATGNKGTSIDSIKKTEEEHPIASTIGNAAGKIGQYAVGSQVMQSIPAVASLTGKAGQALAKFPLLSKVGAKPIANVLSDTMLDLGLDTLPSTVGDIQAGKSGGEVTGNALKNLGANLAFNIAGEGIGAGLKKIGSVNQAKKAISVDEIEALRQSVIPKVEAPEVKVPEIINTIPKVEVPKVETPKVEAPTVEAPTVVNTIPKVEATVTNTEIPNVEIPKTTPARVDGQIKKPEVQTRLEKKPEGQLLMNLYDENFAPYERSFRNVLDKRSASDALDYSFLLLNKKNIPIRNLEMEMYKAKIAAIDGKLTFEDHQQLRGDFLQSAFELDSLVKKKKLDSELVKGIKDDYQRFLYELRKTNDSYVNSNKEFNKLIDERNAVPKVEVKPTIQNENQLEIKIPQVEPATVELPKPTVSKMETTTSKALENLTSKLDPIEKNYAINSQALRQSMNEMLEKANRGEMTDADWDKIVSDISENGNNIKNTLTGKQLVDDVATKENITSAKKTFNQVKKITTKNQVYVDKDILREMGLSDKKKLEAANNWFGMNITKVPSGDNVITVSDFLKAIPDDVKAVMNVNVDSPKDSMKNVIDYMSSTFKNTMRKTKNDIPYSVYKNTDEEVGSIAREMNNYLDELNDIDKLAKQSIPTKEAVNQIPSVMPQASQVDNVVKEIPTLKPQVASDVFQPEIAKTKVDANGQMAMDVPVIDRKTSSFATHTANSPIFDKVRKNMEALKEEGSFDYDVLHEIDSLEQATKRISENYEGELKNVLTGEMKGAVDTDVAMGIASKEIDRATSSISNESLNELLQNSVRNYREQGRGIQALAKYSRTPEGTLLKASKLLVDKADDLDITNPKLVNKISSAAKNIMSGTNIEDALKNTGIKKIDMDAVEHVKKLLDNGVSEKGLENALKIYAGSKKWGISDETMSQVKTLLTKASEFGENSKQAYDLEMQAYSMLSKELPSGSFIDRWNSWRYLGMLGNTRTHIRNTVGNGAMNIVTGAKNNIAAVLETPLKNKTKAILNPISSKDKALLNGAKLDVNEQYKRIMGKNKYSIDTSISETQKVFSNKALGKVANKLEELNSKALNAEDNLALKSKYTTSLAGYLKANGADESIFKAQDKESLDLLEKAREYAIGQANIATFHNSNKFADIISNFKRDLGKSDSVAARATGKIMEGILPFVKTPLNILREGVDYSGGAYIRAVTDGMQALFRGTKTANDVIDDLAKGLTGSGMMLVGAGLGAAGIITASGSDDKRKSNYDEMNGSQNYSFNVFGHSFTIDFLAPAALQLFVGVELQKALSQDGLSKDEIVNALSNISEPILETSMLQGLESVLDSVKYSQNNSLSSIATTAATSYLGQGIPTVFGQVARAVDPMRRDTYTGSTGTSNVLEKELNKVQNKIPFLSMQNNEYVDAFGNTQENFGGSFVGRLAYSMLSPSYIAPISDDPVKNPLNSIYDETNESKVLPERSNGTVTINKEKVKLDEDTYQRFQTEKGKTSHALVNEFLNSGAFDRMNSTDQAETVSDLYQLSTYISGNKTVKGYNTENKLYEIYKEKGTDGVFDYIEAGYVARDMEIPREVAGEYLGNDKILKAYSEVEKISKTDKGNVSSDGEPRSFASSKDENKFKYLNMTELSNEEKGMLLYRGSNSEKLTQIQKQYGNEGVYNYYSIKNIAGDNKTSSVTSVLKNSDMSENDKGIYLETISGQISSGAKNAKAIYGNEGVYQYYLHKQLADADGNGNLKKSEVEQYLAYQQMADEMKATWERLLSN